MADRDVLMRALVHIALLACVSRTVSPLRSPPVAERLHYRAGLPAHLTPTASMLRSVQV